MAASQVYRLFEDSRGNIWIATTSSTTNGLARWNADSEQVRDLGRSPGLPSLKDDLPLSFGEDASGAVWIGFGSGLARFANDTFTFFAASEGLRPSAIRVIHRDRSGRLWLGTDRAGLIRVDHAEATRPTFVQYSTTEGLSTNDVEVITEDNNGFLYMGGGQGLDRFDPTTGRVKHFTEGDGLTPGLLAAGLRDRHGVLWFGTSNGLARLKPRTDPPPVAPRAFVSAVRVAGHPQLLSALGEHFLSLPDVAPDQNHVEIDFVALGFAAGEVLRYQYKLEGTNADWSLPSGLRTVNFANLAPGHYAFLVRAVNSDGAVSPQPATVAFVVLGPLWYRWWFLTLAAALLGGMVLAVYRYRVSRVLELAAIRTRIATDLHDDIGANLTRISLLSEVAQRGHDRGALTSIASIARDSVSAMSDIVWAVNPKRESLADLVRRMRHHGEDVFTLREIDLQFGAPDPGDTLRLGMDVRRDLLLFFKEAVNNTARHSQCSRVSIDLSRRGSRLVLSVADNGVGFDPSVETPGQGLTSLRRRAERLKGTLEIRSAPRTGTTVTLQIPL